MSTETLYCLMPEMVLIIAATLIYVAGCSSPGARTWSAIALGAMLLTGWMLYGQYTNLFWAGGHPVRDAVAAEVEHAKALTSLCLVSGQADSVGRHCRPAEGRSVQPVRSLAGAGDRPWCWC